MLSVSVVGGTDVVCTFKYYIHMLHKMLGLHRHNPLISPAPLYRMYTSKLFLTKIWILCHGFTITSTDWVVWCNVVKCYVNCTEIMYILLPYIVMLLCLILSLCDWSWVCNKKRTWRSLLYRPTLRYPLLFWLFQHNCMNAVLKPLYNLM